MLRPMISGSLPPATFPVTMANPWAYYNHAYYENYFPFDIDAAGGYYLAGAITSLHHAHAAEHRCCKTWG